MSTPAWNTAVPMELDEETFCRAQDGDSRAFRALVERYHVPVYDLLWRMLEHQRGQARVEELAQETFLRVYKALPRFSYEGPARLSTWILTIATRLAFNELRRPMPQTVPVDALDNQLAGPLRTENGLERRLMGEAIRAAISELRPEFRAVFVLRDYHDLRYREIAEILEVEIGTVRSRLARARAALRKALREVHEVHHG